MDSDKSVEFIDDSYYDVYEYDFEKVFEEISEDSRNGWGLNKLRKKCIIKLPYNINHPSWKYTVSAQTSNRQSFRWLYFSFDGDWYSNESDHQGSMDDLVRLETYQRV